MKGDRIGSSKGKTRGISSSNGRSVRANYVESNETDPAKGCINCKSSTHEIYRCDKFLSVGVKERWNVANRLKICHVCLKPGHRKRSSRCHVKKNCKGCGSANHNTLLCSKEKPPEPPDHKVGSRETETKKAYTVTASDMQMNVFPGGKSLLPVVPVILRVPGQSKEVKANALLDCGCDGTLTATSVANKMGCKVDKKIKLRINHACGYKTVEASKIDALEVKGIDKSDWHLIRGIECVPELPSHGNPMVDQQININKFPYLKDLTIPSFSYISIDMIIGTNNEQMTVLQDRRTAGRWKWAHCLAHTPRMDLSWKRFFRHSRKQPGVELFSYHEMVD